MGEGTSISLSVSPDLSSIRDSERAREMKRVRQVRQSMMATLFTHSAPFVCHSPPFRGTSEKGAEKGERVEKEGIYTSVCFVPFFGDRVRKIEGRY